MSVRSASPQTVFILWAERFDEASATTFVCELRAAGRRVKVVGVDGWKSAGVHGMVLTPDMTLEQALKQVNQAGYVVLPCNVSAYARLSNDPRLIEFCHKAAAHHAALLVGSYQKVEGALDREQCVQDGLCAGFEQVIQYPSQEFLVDFVRKLPQSGE